MKEVTATRSRTHGHASRDKMSGEYRAWLNMRGRCFNPKVFAYPWYGARGITVHPAWRESFEAFIADVGPRPSPRHSLERIDVNGHYEPGNVTWATHREQCANKRNNRMLTAFGETLHMQEWCRRTGILQGTLWDRLDRGWNAERALSTPVTKRK